MLQVKKVVGSILSSNMYILFEESSSDCWIVDMGDFHALKEALPNDLIQLMNMVGYVLITGIAFNFLSDKKIKVANMLPSLIIVIIYYFISNLF